MKIRFSIILFAVAALALVIEGCSTPTAPTKAPATIKTASAFDIMPIGFNPTNAVTNAVVVTGTFAPQYSLTNVIFPTAYTSGFYIYALTIGQGWGYVTNQPPFEITFPSNNLLLYNGEYGDSGTNTGTLSVNPYSPAYRFGVKAPGDDGTHGSNYPLTMIGFALPMMITVSNEAPNVHLSVYGLNKDYRTYEIQQSADLSSWSNLVSIPISNATYTVDVPISNAANFYRVANLITNQ